MVAVLIVRGLAMAPDFGADNVVNIAPEASGSQLLPFGAGDILAALPAAGWLSLAIEDEPLAAEETSGNPLARAADEVHRRGWVSRVTSLVGLTGLIASLFCQPQVAFMVLGVIVIYLLGLACYWIHSRHHLVADAPEEEFAVITQAEKEVG